MAVSVTPNSPRNTHHLALTDGVNTVGLKLCDMNGKANPRAFQVSPVVRQSIKFYTGEQQLSDLEPPWQDVVINDFSGGRGGEKYEADTSRYWDGRQVDTSKGYAILAPMEIWDKNTAVKAHNMEWSIWSGSTYPRKPYTSYALYGDTDDVAASFVTPSAYTIKYVFFYGKVVGNPASDTITITIRQDSAGSPNTILPAAASGTVTLTEELRLHRVVLDGAALNSATTYWVCWEGNDGTDSASNHKMILCDGTTKTEKVKPFGMSSWSAGSNGLPYFRCEEEGKDARIHFAEIKNCLYAALEYEDGTVSKVFQNGTQGKATAGDVNYIRDSNNSTVINNDTFNGGVIEITAGLGSHLPSPWRPIYDTLDTNSEIQVEPDWPGAPDTTSEYTIYGSDRWTEVTGHGLAAGEYITDALSIAGAIYFACGPSQVILRLRNYYSSGYWQWKTDETGYAHFLVATHENDQSTIWKALRTLPAQAASVAAADCTGTGAVAALTFGTAENIGDVGEKITGLQVYGESYPEVYVFKEGSIHRLVNGTWQELRISGLRSARDARNGYASTVNGVYLYFSFLDSIERYYNGSLDDIGPNRDGALPINRRGMISAMTTYLNRLYVAIDGGTYNYSSILCFNGIGYHEVWRAPSTGVRIYGKLHVQPIPGDNADRLFFSYDGDIISLCVANSPYYHNGGGATENFQYYAFCPGGSIETGWIHYGLESIDKLFNSVTVFGENLVSTNSRLFLDYMLDDDTTWTQVGQFTISNDSGRLYFDDTNHNLTGKRIKLRIRMETLYNNVTPKLEAIVLEGVATVPNKNRISMTCSIEDDDFDLVDNIDDTSDADTKLSRIRTWASQAGTIGMSGHIDELNGLRIKLDYPSIQLIKHVVNEVNHKKKNVYILSLEAWVID